MVFPHKTTIRIHCISYFFLAFGTQKLFYKALLVTALTTLNCTNPLLMLKSHYSDSHITNGSFLNDARTDYHLFLFKSTLTSKDNVINETEFQLIQYSVSEEGYLLVTLGLKPCENKRKRLLFA